MLPLITNMTIMVIFVVNDRSGLQWRPSYQETCRSSQRGFHKGVPMQQAA